MNLLGLALVGALGMASISHETANVQQDQIVEMHHFGSATLAQVRATDDAAGVTTLQRVIADTSPDNAVRFRIVDETN